jgi:anti-sigma factor RsiW
MSANGWHEKWEAYADGELAPKEKAGFETHLETCAECRTKLADWKTISGKLFSGAEETVSDSFAERVAARLETSSARPVRWGGARLVPVQWLAPLIGVAAMLVLAIVPAGEGLSAEALFMGGEPDGSSRWVAADGAPQTDEALGFVMEGR